MVAASTLILVPISYFVGCGIGYNVARQQYLHQHQVVINTQLVQVQAEKPFATVGDFDNFTRHEVKELITNFSRLKRLYSEHVENSPPDHRLHLRVEENGNYNCAICFNDKMLEEFTIFNCGHATCTDCDIQAIVATMLARYDIRRHMYNVDDDVMPILGKIVDEVMKEVTAPIEGEQEGADFDGEHFIPHCNTCAYGRCHITQRYKVGNDAATVENVV